MKTCKGCGVALPLDAFSPNGGGYYRSRCRGCRSGAERAKPKAMTDVEREKMWAHNIRRRFKMTPERYAEMLAEQGGVCRICDAPDKRGRRLSVDHDHSCCPTNSSKNKVLTCGSCVRGLICTDCNTMLGLAYDRVDVLLSAVKYLNTYVGKIS